MVGQEIRQMLSYLGRIAAALESLNRRDGHRWATEREESEGETKKDSSFAHKSPKDQHR